MQEADSNYAPPKAVVTDLGPRVRPPMPRVVRVAVILVCAYMAAGIVSGIKVYQMYGPPALLGAILVAALFILVAYFITRASRVARIAFLVIVLWSVASNAYLLSQPNHSFLIPLPAYLAGMICRLGALCLLYTKPANSWFRWRAA